MANESLKRQLKSISSPTSFLVSGVSACASIGFAMLLLPRIPELETIRVQAFSIVWAAGFLTAFILNLGLHYQERTLLRRYAVPDEEKTQPSLTALKSMLNTFTPLSEDLMNLFTHSPLLIAIADFDTQTLLRVNPAWEKLLGWTPEELTSEPWVNFIHRDDLPETSIVVSALSGKLANVYSMRFRNRYRDKQGQYHWIEWHSTLFIAGRAYCIAMASPEQGHS